MEGALNAISFIEQKPEVSFSIAGEINLRR
jgi:hypothetical protein